MQSARCLDPATLSLDNGFAYGEAETGVAFGATVGDADTVSAVLNIAV